MHLLKKARDLLKSNIVRLREAQGLTQPELAEAAGLSPQMIQKLEYGETNPSMDTLDALARALKCHPLEFFAPPEANGQRPPEPQDVASEIATKLISEIRAFLIPLVLSAGQKSGSDLWQAAAAYLLSGDDGRLPADIVKRLRELEQTPHTPKSRASKK